MPLQVIGAGFGRTGTNSLRLALELLGYPTYHMFVLVTAEFDSHFHLWEKLATIQSKEERKNVLKQIFDDSKYTAAVDFPASLYWKELSELYPEAKVILTVRDETKWAESVRDTISFSPKTQLELSRVWYGGIIKTFQIPRLKRFDVWITKWWFPLFGEGNDFQTEENRKRGIEVLVKHISEVEQSLSSKRLLVFDVAQGWDPLCTFLQKDPPTLKTTISKDEKEENQKFIVVPFPRSNDKEEFAKMLTEQRMLRYLPSILATGLLFGGVSCAIYFLIKNDSFSFSFLRK